MTTGPGGERLYGYLIGDLWDTLGWLYTKPACSMENIMKIINKFLLIVVIGLFPQLSLAQGAGGVLKEIADIVASINHFPSDADKTKLMAISDNGNLPQGLRGMATAVATINHSTNAEGKEALARIAASDQAPDRAKALAGIISDLNHVPSDEAKSTLAELFP